MKVIRFFAVLVIFFISNDLFAQEDTISDCAQIINGKITDEFSNNPIKNVTVEVRDTNEKLVLTDITNSNGNYHFNLPCKKQYTILYSKKGYIISTTQIKTSKTNKRVERRDITLHQKICNQSIKGLIVNSKTNKPVKNASVIILKNNIELKKFTNLTNGTFRYETECFSEYKIKVSAPNFGFVTKLFQTTDINKQSFELTFNLNPVIKAIVKNVRVSKEKQEEKPIVKKEPIIKNKPSPKLLEVGNIKFDLNQSKINRKIASELDKIIQLMNINPKITVVLNSHTDNRGPSQYNSSLTEARAQSMISYIISNGIDAIRVTGNGYGETKPINKCSKEKRCTEKEHQKNKRIEFIISNNESN